MEENTATVNVSFTVKLTSEGSDADGNYISAEDKATATAQIVRDQIAAIKRTYDTGVEIVNGKLTYTGVSNEALK